mgnify:CR=1 FL=1
MEKKIIEDRKTEVLDDIICDSCGKSCAVDEGIVDNDVRLDHGTKYKSFEFMELKASWGYHSKGKDLTYWKAHLCEECVDTKLSFINFKKGNTRITSILTNKD